MEKIPYLSSAGLRVIHEAFIRLRSASGDVTDGEMRKGINDGTYKSPHLKLLKPGPNARKALETAGFDMYLDIFDDLDAAIATF
jgi:hypothetical protein